MVAKCYHGSFGLKYLSKISQTIASFNVRHSASADFNVSVDESAVKELPVGIMKQMN